MSLEWKREVVMYSESDDDDDDYDDDDHDEMTVTATHSSSTACQSCLEVCLRYIDVT